MKVLFTLCECQLILIIPTSIHSTHSYFANCARWLDTCDFFHFLIALINILLLRFTCWFQRPGFRRCIIMPSSWRFFGNFMGTCMHISLQTSICLSDTCVIGRSQYDLCSPCPLRHSCGSTPMNTVSSRPMIVQLVEVSLTQTHSLVVRVKNHARTSSYVSRTRCAHCFQEASDVLESTLLVN